MVFRGQDAWRRHPIFTWKFVNVFPGLREGAAAFGVYVAAEYVYKKMNPESHGHHGSHGAEAKPAHH